MYYSDLYFQQKNKHSSFLFAVAFFSIAGFLAFFFKAGGGNVITTKASNVNIAAYKVVNLSPVGAEIFWQTETIKKNSYIIYGESKSKIDKLVLDERNTASQIQAYLNHHVIIRGLTPEKKYYYRIVTDEVMFPGLSDDPLSFTTPQNKDIRSSLGIAYGRKVIQANNELPVENAFVIFYFEKYLPLMTMTKPDGSFIIPLNYLVDLKINDQTIPSEDEIVSIEVFNDTSKAKIKARLSQTKNLPVIILGKEDQDLTKEEQVLAATSQVEVNKKTDENIAIIFPKENSIIPASKPLIKGVVLPNKEVYITINSKPEYSFRTKSNSKGEWKVIPQSSIIAGDYILTMATKDEQDNQYLIKRNFSIAKGGEQVLGDATAEPTIVQPTPTIFISPTVDINQYITPTATPPVTGSNDSWLLFMSTSLIIVGLGILLVF